MADATEKSTGGEPEIAETARPETPQAESEAARPEPGAGKGGLGRRALLLRGGALTTGRASACSAPAPSNCTITAPSLTLSPTFTTTDFTTPSRGDGPAPARAGCGR